MNTDTYAPRPRLTALVLVALLAVAVAPVTAPLPDRPPAGQPCAMGCWTWLHACLGRCHADPDPEQCSALCTTTYEICRWRCSVLPPAAPASDPDAWCPGAAATPLWLAE